MRNLKKKMSVALVILSLVSSFNIVSRPMGGDAQEPAPRPIAAPIVPQQRSPQVAPRAPQAPAYRPAAPAPAPAAKPAPAPYVPVAQPMIQRPLSYEPIKFTQTEAYLQIPALRDLVTKQFTGSYEPVKHMDIVSRTLAKEAEFRNTHWCFYHGATNDWAVWQDAYAALLGHFNPSMDIGDSDFIFFRQRGQKKQTATKFLVDQLKESGLVDDTILETKLQLLSVNLTLFSNARLPKENTWMYMLEAQSHAEPIRKLFESIMDEFGLPYTHVNELMALTKLLEGKEETLIQVFVPKNIVDEVGYLAWTRGIPAHGPSIDWVKRSKIKAGEGHSAAFNALGALINKFAKEHEKNPLYKEMLETIQSGGFSINEYLKRLCNDPRSLTHIDDVQARLVFTDDFLLNPASGVKMFRYYGVGYKQWNNYKSRLDAVIKKIVASKR